MRTQITINTNEMDKAQLTWDKSLDEAYQAAMDDVNAYNFLGYTAASISDGTIYLTLDFDTEGYIDSVQEIARSYIKLFLDVSIGKGNEILEKAVARGDLDEIPDDIMAYASEINEEGMMVYIVTREVNYAGNSRSDRFMLYKLVSVEFGRIKSVHSFGFNNVAALSLFILNNYGESMHTKIDKMIRMYLNIYARDSR